MPDKLNIFALVVLVHFLPFHHCPFCETAVPIKALEIYLDIRRGIKEQVEVCSKLFKFMYVKMFNKKKIYVLQTRSPSDLV